MHASTYAYWIIVKCILRYFNATTNHGLQITSSLTFLFIGLLMLIVMEVWMIVNLLVIILFI